MKRSMSWKILAPAVGFLLLSWMLVTGQDPGTGVPFFTTPSIQAAISSGASAGFIFYAQRPNNGVYVQGKVNMFAPFSWITSTAAVTEFLMNGGMANLLTGPGGPANVGRAAQFGGGGKFTSAGAGGIAYLSFEVSDKVFVTVASPSFTYTGTTPYPVGENVAGLIAADFNGDSVLDLAITYQGNFQGAPGGVAILINKGDGTFKPAVSYSAGTTPNALAAFDVNKDHILDLVVSDNATSSIYVLIGNANGTFNAAVPYQAAGSGDSVTVADFNNDGNPDIAGIGGFPASVATILLGNGNGTFHAGATFPIGSARGYIAAGDLNGDAKMDLAIASAVAQTVTTFLGAGDGTFQRLATYATSYHPDGLVLADFNHDGKLDVLVAQGDARAFGANPDSDNIDVLLGNGDGTLQAAFVYPVGGGPSMLAVADVNKDGKLDIITPNPFSNDVSVLLGQGGGKFHAGTTLTLPNSGGTLPRPNAVAAGDLNGDGNIDLALAESNLSKVGVAFGKGDGTFQAPLQLAVSMQPRFVAIGDFNGDQKPDLAVANYGDTSFSSPNPGNVSIILATGGGNFQPAANMSAGDHPLFIASADLNGDGKLDLVAVNEGVFDGDPGGASIFLGKGDGTFQPAQNVAAGVNPTSVAIGDINGDGRLDLAITTEGPNFGFFIAVLLGNGDGTFQAAKLIKTDFGPASVVIRDYSGDGKADLIIAHCCGDTDMTYMIGNGDGTFQPEVHFIGGTSPQFIATGDFTGDGKPDLAIINQGISEQGAVTVLLNTQGSTPACTYTLSSTSLAPTTAGGSFSIGIQTSANCPWSVTGLPSWITVSGNASGTGAGSVTLVVAANTNVARSAGISVAGVNVTVNQAGAFSCTYTLSAAQVQAPIAGGNFTLTLATGQLCAWSITGLPDWITVSGAASGTGPTGITLVVAANAGDIRSATVTVGGATVTVTQAAPVVCTYTLNASGQVFSSAGGTATISIAAPAGCTWSVFGNPSWVVLKSAASGSGNGTLSYQVGFNQGADRSGTIQIANSTYTIEQVSATLVSGTVAGSMAQIASAGGWKTTFTLINTGNAAAQVRLNFFGDNGNPLLLPLTFPQSGINPASQLAVTSASPGPLLAPTIDRTLSAGASLVIESTGPDSQAVQVGWAQLVSTGSVRGFATFTVSASHQEAVVPLETRNAGVYLLAFDNTSGLLTGLALANTSAQAAVIPMVIRDDTGAPLGTPSINLAAQGHTSFMLTQNYAATAGKRGTIEFHTPAGGQISVLGLRANAAALTTLPLLANVSGGGGSMAQVASGGGWKTTFTFVNTGTGAAQITLDFSDNSGAALSLPLGFPQTAANVTASSVTKSLAPNTSVIVETQGLNSQAVVVGSARLTTSGNVGGFAIFRDGGTGQEAVVPLETRAGGSYILAFDNTDGLATGLALANVSTQAASVFVTLRSDTGAVLGTTTINLPAHGHTSFLLSPAYAATTGKRGTVQFDTPAGGSISVLGLRATPSATLTTIPTVPR